MAKHSTALVFSLLLTSLVFGRPGNAIAQSSDHKEGLHENRPDTYALTGARVYDTATNVVEGATITIRNGRVAAVGGEIPADAIVVDLSGKTVYPGFIDSFSEIARPNRELQGSPYWNTNVTPQTKVSDFYAPNTSDTKKYRSQGFVARLVAPAGGIVKGQSSIVQTNDKPAKQAVLGDGAMHVRLTVTRRRGGGPRTASSYPNSPMGAFTLARQAFYDAEWFKTAWKAIKNDKSITVPENNDALAAMVPFLNSQSPVVVDTSNELYALRADRFGREFGLNVVINGSGNEYRRLEDVRATGPDY